MIDTIRVVSGLVDFYAILILVYVLMSWLHPRGAVYEVYRTLGTLVEPYLGFFRRFIPPMGMMDVSPIAAILVLRLVSQLLRSLALR